MMASTSAPATTWPDVLNMYERRSPPPSAAVNVQLRPNSQVDIIHAILVQECSICPSVVKFQSASVTVFAGIEKSASDLPPRPRAFLVLPGLLLKLPLLFDSAAMCRLQTG